MKNIIKTKPSRETILRLCNRYALVLHFAASLILYFLIEWMARHSFSLAETYFHVRTKVFLYNSILIFLTTLPVFFFKKRAFLRTLIYSLWLALGAANGVVLANRVTPLTGPDFRMFKEAASVFSRYLSKAAAVIVIVIAVLLVAAYVFLYFKGPVFEGKRHPVFVAAGILAAVIGFAGLTQYFYSTRLLSTYFGNIAFAYEDYGFPYCLTVTLTDTGIDKPQGYSEKMVSDITNAEEKTDKEGTADLPNILIVQLESFFDPQTVRFLDCSEDPLPNWHALSREYTSGRFTVPTVGAGTVNTEFETLTGMSLRFFGAGEYPYKGVLRECACESVAYVLEDLGLTAHAVHNNYATFYSRHKVYPNLGFQDFTSNEYMDNQDDVNELGWMRDRTLIPYIGKCLDATENRDFVFAVSVQGHGAYPSADLIEEPVIEVTGTGSTEKDCQWEYYVNQIHEMDQFIKDLVEYVDKRGEPAVILFYGDHLPTMGLKESDLTTGTTYQTSYLIWDNIGLARRRKNICAYQAVAELFDCIDLHEGTMFRFHQSMQKNESYQLDLQTLQYDILYGERYVYKQSEGFSRTEMKLGIDSITLTSLEQAAENMYFVHGSNFTESSKVVVAEEEYPTLFMDDHTLLVRDLELEDGQIIQVGQRSNSGSGKFLSYTNAIIYSSDPKDQGETAEGEKRR